MEEEIRDIFEKFPQDCSCSRAGEREEDLDRHGDVPNKFLSVRYRGQVEICDRNASYEMGWYIQWGICQISTESFCNAVDNKNAERSPAPLA